MGKLVYSMSVSVDGFVETPEHSLAWADIDEEIDRLFNEQAPETAAFLYGRRLYEVIAPYWQHAESDPMATDFMIPPATERPIRLYQTEFLRFGSGACLHGYSRIPARS